MVVSEKIFECIEARYNQTVTHSHTESFFVFFFVGFAGGGGRGGWRSGILAGN